MTEDYCICGHSEMEHDPTVRLTVRFEACEVCQCKRFRGED